MIHQYLGSWWPKVTTGTYPIRFHKPWRKTRVNSKRKRKKESGGTELIIRITLMRIRIQTFTRIRIRIRIQIQLLIKVMVICDRWSRPSKAPFWASRPLLWAFRALQGSIFGPLKLFWILTLMRIRIQLSTLVLTRIRIQLPKTMRIRICNPGEDGGGGGGG